MLEKLEFYVAIDFFLNETARHADVVLPGSLQEEDEGIVTKIEGRVIKINKAIDRPGEARRTGGSFRTSPRRWAARRASPSTARARSSKSCASHRRAASPTTPASPMRRSSEQHGVFWPCPSDDHPGTPRLFEPGSWNPVAQGAGPFYFPDGKARFNVAPYTPPAEDIDAEYPLMLTTGRVVSHFLSGTQTRRIGPLVDQYPEPRIELHPQLAERLGIVDGDWIDGRDRAAGACTLRARVVTTIRPDTIFIPYHWAGPKSANQLTIAAQDPISKIPEYKVCAVRVRKAAERPPEYARQAGAAAIGRTMCMPLRTWNSSSTPAAASAARRACRRAASATRTRATR